jgi:c-di-GMP-binding flagellar brake protein YcgR
MATCSLVPLSSTPIVIGQPLPFPIFDAGGRLLLSAGDTPRSAQHIQRIHEIGMVDAEVAERAHAAARPAKGAPATPGRSPPAPMAPAIEPAGDALRAGACRLTALRLPSGTPVQVSQPGDPPRRLTGTLIGILPQDAIYVGLPTIDGRPALALHGGEVGFRCVLGTEIVRFDTVLLHNALLPFPVAVLAYPPDISVQRFRRHPRAPALLDAVATNYASSDAAALPCRIINLSVGGLQVEYGSGAMKVADQVGFDLVLPGLKPRNALKLMGVVRNVAVTEDPDIQRCGVEFTPLDPQQALLLEHFVLRTLAERPRVASGA